MNRLKTLWNRSSSANTLLGAKQKIAVLAALTMMAVMSWLAGPQTTVSAQTACMLDCEEAYVRCISSPNPLPEGGCIDRYEQCCEACLGN